MFEYLLIFCTESIGKVFHRSSFSTSLTLAHTLQLFVVFQRSSQPLVPDPLTVTFHRKMLLSPLCCQEKVENNPRSWSGQTESRGSKSRHKRDLDAIPQKIETKEYSIYRQSNPITPQILWSYDFLNTTSTAAMVLSLEPIVAARRYLSVEDPEGWQRKWKVDNTPCSSSVEVNARRGTNKDDFHTLPRPPPLTTTIQFTF